MAGGNEKALGPLPVDAQQTRRRQGGGFAGYYLPVRNESAVQGRGNGPGGRPAGGGAALLRRALRDATGEKTNYLIAMARACEALGDDSCSRETLQRLRELAPGHPEVQALAGALEADVKQAME